MTTSLWKSLLSLGPLAILVIGLMWVPNMAGASPLALKYSIADVGGGLYQYNFALELDNHDGSWVLGQGWSWIVFGDAPSPGPSPLTAWSGLTVDPPFTGFTGSSGGHNGPTLAPVIPTYWQPAAVGEILTWSGTSTANLMPGQVLFSTLILVGGATRADFEVAIEVLCGNGLPDGGEQCDDGNTLDGDCCSSTCQYESSGSPCPDDGNVCTDDQCDSAGTCQHLNNTAGCDDNVFCNGADNCSGGSCSIHSGDPCDGPDSDGNCSETCDEGADNCLAEDPDGSACTDGLFCNGTDTCSGGSCSSHTGDPCPGADGDANCSESCDEVDDNCMAADTNGSSCDNGVFCDGADTCSGGLCSTHAGDPCSGPDGDGDCAESCDEAADMCIAPDTAGSACASDGNVCTDDICDGAGNCGVNNTDHCDDSNACTSDDTCGGGSCNGTPLTCDDGDICTQDSCDMEAGCVYDAVPAVNCKEAGKSILVLKNNADNSKDKLVWKWLKGDATTLSDLGTPTGTTNYTLCLYAGTTGAISASVAMPGGANWQPLGTKGFKYKSTDLEPDGVQKAKLKSGEAGKAKVLVKGKGDNLPDDLVPVLPLPVTAQLVNDNDSICFEAVYDSDEVKKNDEKQFKAKAQ